MVGDVLKNDTMVLTAGGVEKEEMGAEVGRRRNSACVENESRNIGSCRLMFI